MNRRPAKVLAFFGIEPGMKVAEMMAGDGHCTEILAIALGPEGLLYARNTPFVLDPCTRRSRFRRVWLGSALAT